MPINDNFDYTWAPGKGKQNITISFSRRAISIDLEKSGVYLNFDVQIANDSGWKCGNRSVPILPLNPKYESIYLEYMAKLNNLYPMTSTKTS